METLTDSEEGIKTARLEQKSNDAAIIREWLRLPAYKLFEDRLKQEVKVSMDRWFDADSPQAAEEIRQSSKPYHALQKILKKIVMEGDSAEAAIHNLRSI